MLLLGFLYPAEKPRDKSYRRLNTYPWLLFSYPWTLLSNASKRCADAEREGGEGRRRCCCWKKDEEDGVEDEEEGEKQGGGREEGQRKGEKANFVDENPLAKKEGEKEMAELAGEVQVPGRPTTRNW